MNRRQFAAHSLAAAAGAAISEERLHIGPKAPLLQARVPSLNRTKASRFPKRVSLGCRHGFLPERRRMERRRQG